MNLKVNAGAQTILSTATAANLFSFADGADFSTWFKRAQLIVGAAISILQIVISVRGQFSNPDGTPASVAYRRPDSDQ